ncbi:RelA/SpoT family protein [Streptomyces sp. KR55]|uniref:RelA/SpoT family protein n=1 Tax=Streptomyces sp. KR55 TaxID=3457425 RepID=UPI003FD19AEC
MPRFEARAEEPDTSSPVVMNPAAPSHPPVPQDSADAQSSADPLDKLLASSHKRAAKAVREGLRGSRVEEGPEEVTGLLGPASVLHPDTGQPARSGSSNRARLARLGVQRSNPYNPVLEPLLRIVRSNDPKIETATLRQIETAYQVAERWHRGQKRKSGDPYITHPLAVTIILAELGMDPATLMAGLLHDTVEDTEYGLDDLRRDLGDSVALLVDGVTKLDKVKFGEAAQAETVRKMVVAMAKDPRVLVIKLADRLHNMRTMRYLKREKQEKKARETLEIYAPLAHRLGMNTIKWELEDLAFAILYPKMYDEMVRLAAERAPKRDEYLSMVTDEVQQDLRAARIKATVTGLPKHYYSLYQEMLIHRRGFTVIYDLVGIRVFVDTVRDCYAALGTIHNRWEPVPGRFKDYIAMPKSNMYQSLHTTVIGPNGKPVELQIRTFDMHRRAEYGIAAHWKYKQEAVAGASKIRTDAPKSPSGKSGKDAGGINDMAWLRQLLDWQKETVDPGEFLESLRFDLSRNEVFVFTPKGDVIALPVGATPVDFAYAVHTEVGHRTIGARVNGRLVPLESTLDNGDLVEVFTSKAAGAGPSRDWLGFVKSPRASNKIRAWFSEERRHETSEQGTGSTTREQQPERIVGAECVSTESSVLEATIQVEALDRSELLSDVTRVLSDQHVNVLSATVQTSRDLVATCRFTFEMGNPEQLGPVLEAVRGIEGVYNVYRLT